MTKSQQEFTSDSEEKSQMADAPGDFPTDSQGRLSYVIGDLIREKAAQLELGNTQQLVDFVGYVNRAAKPANANPLSLTDAAGSAPNTVTSCPTCGQCANNFANCTQSYAQCKAAYDACVRCPCT